MSTEVTAGAPTDDGTADGTESSDVESANNVDGSSTWINDASTGASPYFTEGELRDYLLNQAQQQWASLFGQTIPQYQYGYGWPIDYFEVDGDSAAANTVTAGGLAAAKVTSDTNTQVAGVDEADFVETDGKYIYVARNSGLTILDTQKAGAELINAADVFGPTPSSWDLSVASEIKMDGNVVGAFLSGDRLTVITQSGYGGWYGPPGILRAVGVSDSFAPWGRWNPQTTVTVIDVSDRTAPSIVDQTTLDGSFRDARAIDGSVYVVVENSFNLPEPLFTDTPVTPDDASTSDPSSVEIPGAEDLQLADGGSPVVAMPIRWGWWNPTVVSNRTYETWDDYVSRVGDEITKLSLPHAFNVDADGNSTDSGAYVNAESIVRPQADFQQTLLTVVSFDMARASAGSGVADSASLQTSWSSAIYMTSDALYVASSEFNSDEWTWSNDTRIDRFSIDGTNIEWQASGVVPGTLINQFAMDEYDGSLRVATHTWAEQWIPSDPVDGTTDGGGGSWSNQNDNGVYVLDTAGNTLDVVGSLTGLASGEQLYATRFIGNTAYLVTFQQIDPLFVIDLSDPSNPAVEGEVEIPGFSSYLQPVGDGELIGLGQERVPGSWFRQLEVSLFNVADGSSPQQVDREYLSSDSGWAWSDAQYDPHAILYSAEDGLLVLPFAASGSDEAGNWFYQQAVSVMRVDPTSGIDLIGTIATDESVFRTVRIDDVLYTISDTSVTAYRLTDLSEIGDAKLFNPEPDYSDGRFYVIPLAAAVGSSQGQTEGGSEAASGGTGTESSTDEVAADAGASTGIGDSASSTATSSSAFPVVIPPARAIFAVSGGFAADNDGGRTILAMAAQVAQNTASNLGWVGAPVYLATTNELAPPSEELGDGNRVDPESFSTNDDGELSASQPSQDSDMQTMDEFWEQAGERLRKGDDPMAPSQTTSKDPDRESPRNANKPDVKKDSASTRSAIENRDTAKRPNEMSQSERIVPRGAASKRLQSIKPTSKTATVKHALKGKSLPSAAGTKRA